MPALPPDRLTVLTPAEYRAAVRRHLADLGLTYDELQAQARDHGGTFTSAQAHDLWMMIGGTVTQAELDADDEQDIERLAAELAEERAQHEMTRAALNRYERAERERVRAQIDEIRTRTAKPPPAPETIAEWDAADREMVGKIRAARPGVPAHHVFAVLQTLRVIQQDASDLTADEARELADDLGRDLYRAQDALAFVGEMCDIADRDTGNGQPAVITTADVRHWLQGAKCGRQIAAEHGGLRGLLEHVGIDTTGRDITIDGKVVDPAPARHRFTVLPVDPAIEAAATARAVQAAADSEKAADWIATHSGVAQPAPPRHPTADGRYLSTGCLHGEQRLPDGRTGHGYCQTETRRHDGTLKTAATCKFCGETCCCPCHTNPTPED